MAGSRNTLHGTRLFGLAMLLCACAAPHNGSLAPVVPSSGTATFAAVLRALLSDTSFTVRPIVADPRPLLGDDAVTSVEATSFAPVPAAEVAARRATMRELGVEAGDASFPPGCGGLLVLPASPSDPVHAGCPATGRLVVAVGLPRIGDRTTDAPEVGARRRTVWVILAGIWPKGISADLRDYVLEGAGTEWRVIHWKRIGFWE